MWWAKARVVHVLLLDGEAATWVTGGDVVRHSLGARLEDGRLEEVLQTLPMKRAAVSYWLGGAHFRLACMPRISGVTSIEEAEAAHGAMLAGQGQTGEVRLATWRPTSPRHPDGGLAFAGVARTGLVSSLERVSGALSAKSVQIRPWWARLPLSRTDRCRDIVVSDTDALTYWRLSEHGALTNAATLNVKGSERERALRRLQVSGALDHWALIPSECDAMGFRVGKLDV